MSEFLHIRRDQNTGSLEVKKLALENTKGIWFLCLLSWKTVLKRTFIELSATEFTLQLRLTIRLNIQEWHLGKTERMQSHDSLHWHLKNRGYSIFILQQYRKKGFFWIIVQKEKFILRLTTFMLLIFLHRVWCWWWGWWGAAVFCLKLCTKKADHFLSSYWYKIPVPCWS